MGKKGKKVDGDKKAALQQKKDAKQEKAARKRLSKEQRNNLSTTVEDSEDVIGSSDQMDQVIHAYKNNDSKTSKINKPIIESLTTGYPLPRANATLEFGTDDKSKNKDQLYLFGGEYFDGVENIVLDELLRFDTQKNEWKQILTPEPRPPARCAHSCVFYKASLYVFGGELASSDQYHHYRDLWKFDLRTLMWTEIKAKNPPSARSGMGVIIWKHYMVVVGGFFEALRETKWYNDVHVFDLQSETWMDVLQSRLVVKPEPRSACNVALYGTDKIVVHGGFSKVKTSNAAAETKTHTDAWILHLSPILQQKPPTWERWMSSTKSITSNSPNGRAGMSSLSYKNRMVVFGGVVDHEELNHKVDSVFYNDLMVMDIERRKWFPLRIKKTGDGAPGGASENRRRRRKNDGDDEVGNDEEVNKERSDELSTVEEDDDSSSSDLEEEIAEDENNETQKNSGWDLSMLRSNMFAFVISDSKKIIASSVMALNETTNVPEAVQRQDPLPRINAATIVHGNMMYMLGGILEVGDREITLDDMWALDLRKRDQWECLWQGTMHKQVWRGAVHDDDDSYISTGVEDDSDEEDFLSDENGEYDEATDLDRKKSKRAGLRHEVTDLNEKYDLGDQNRTPANGESLADFYSRTSDYWNKIAAELIVGVDSELTNKELKRQGFICAKERYEELSPVLDRLAELGIGDVGVEDGKRKSKDAKKKDKKEKKKKSSKR
ncbi:hypothetical protein FRACYDRAFT_205433 [Fragilariopsis cylindrus CCMP1102]|uniref:DUF4110 domain-containing protein n=1 Tax=Fragilariopsis cylindrus CCMP1102 TaxID=635003 RepID=A0A1E7FX33_9STRA|nr:hypothetical protein FRACYDRAFT_205433 [Fragilariopsis cylindrus CCMP1102]|eukprot:OEU22699.1 hypothetical protein FRACYDRAFT_205433 [Fragilariopsis cylindrus CCMP1102]